MLCSHLSVCNFPIIVHLITQIFRSNWMKVNNHCVCRIKALDKFAKVISHLSLQLSAKYCMLKHRYGFHLC